MTRALGIASVLIATFAGALKADQSEMDWAFSTFLECIEDTRQGVVFGFSGKGYAKRDHLEAKCTIDHPKLNGDECKPKEIHSYSYKRTMPSGAVRRVFTSGPSQPRYQCGISTSTSDAKLVKAQLRAFSQSPPAGLSNCRRTSGVVTCRMEVKAPVGGQLIPNRIYKLRAELKRDKGGELSLDLRRR